MNDFVTSLHYFFTVILRAEGLKHLIDRISDVILSEISDEKIYILSFCSYITCVLQSVFVF